MGNLQFGKKKLNEMVTATATTPMLIRGRTLVRGDLRAMMVMVVVMVMMMMMMVLVVC